MYSYIRKTKKIKIKNTGYSPLPRPSGMIASGGRRRTHKRDRQIGDDMIGNIEGKKVRHRLPRKTTRRADDGGAGIRSRKKENVTEFLSVVRLISYNNIHLQNILYIK